MIIFSPPRLPAMAVIAASVLLSACSAASGPAHAAAPGHTLGAQATAAQPLPTLTVHKSPDCGCCGIWVEHVRAAGFPVQVKDSDDLMAIKQRLGIPGEMLSCHTTEVDGYVIEGHVPAADIVRLLQQRPKARGLLLPGMPIGSPGMESPDGYRQPFTVALLAQDGGLSRFAEHP